MIRGIYISLLRLHPRGFRQRFAEEMIEDFDTSPKSAAARLFLDVLVSLFRQWMLRPDFSAVPAVAVPAVSEIPMFASLDDYRPRRSALFYGGVLSIGVLFFVAFAIGHGGVRRVFSIGIQRPGLGLIPIDRSAFQESPNATVVHADPAPEDPLQVIAAFYFKVNLIARALDADHDLSIAPWEVLRAPAVLAKLDLDGDGKLSPEECGFRPGQAARDPAFLERARAGYMRVHPLQAALDADRNGEISANEIANSVTALWRMDRNRDGTLAPIEILPDLQTREAVNILVWLDTDNDGRISAGERDASIATPVRGLLDRADANRDGIVTEEELLAELRRRYESKRQIDRATRSMMH
jgi:hypothetical protein